VINNENVLELKTFDDSSGQVKRVSFHVDFSGCVLDMPFSMADAYRVVMSGICPHSRLTTVADVKKALDSYTPSVFVTNPAYMHLFTISFEDGTRYKIEKAESNDDGGVCYVVTKINTAHFPDTFNLDELPYKVDFSKTKNTPDNPHKAFLNFVDQRFWGDCENLESFIKSQKAMKNMLNDLSVRYNNDIAIGDTSEHEHHCFCVTIDGHEFNIINHPGGFYAREIYSGVPTKQNEAPKVEASTKITITRLDDLPLPYIVDFSENKKVYNGWSEKELESLFKENMRELDDQMHVGMTIRPILIYTSYLRVKQFLRRASVDHKKQVKRIRGQHLFKVIFDDVTYAIIDTGKVHAYCRVIEHKTQPMNTNNPQEAIMSKPSATESVDARLQKLEDAFKRDTAAIATDQLKTERKLQALEKDYNSQAKQLEHVSMQLRNLHIKNMELENRVNAGVRYLNGLTASNPLPFSTWADNPNSAFGHPPQNPSFTAWHSPTRSSGMSNFDSPVPPDQSPFKGWGRSDQSAFVHPGNVPPASTIKPADLPPYPGAVVSPQDLFICNWVVTCCIGSDGGLYRLTKDTIIAHTVPWEELSPVAFNKVDWRSDNTQWGIFKESAGEDLPKGTLVYSKSNRSTGLIVRYPDKKYDFNIVNL
jgi:hypothetical protein